MKTKCTVLENCESTYNCSGQASIHFVLGKQENSWGRDCACLIITTTTPRKINTSCILMVPPGQTELREPLARNTQKQRGSRTSCNSMWKLLCACCRHWANPVPAPSSTLSCYMNISHQVPWHPATQISAKSDPPHHCCSKSAKPWFTAA